MYKLAGVTKTCHNGRRAVAAVQEVSLEMPHHCSPSR
jgi:hypothetical protein